MSDKTTKSMVIDSPIGPLTLTSDGEYLIELWLEGLPNSDNEDGKTDPILIETKRQLEAYFEGKLTEFDLPIHFAGTPFQTKVWHELTKIPYGETISYGELALRAGNAKAPRAVGMANHNNPIAIVVPCHRVIGANGKLVGYGGGLWRKQKLLDLERGVSGVGALSLDFASAE